LALLQRAAWPGNVRELEHAVERAVILSPSPLLAPSAFDGQRFGLADDAEGPRARFTRPATSPATEQGVEGAELGHILKLPTLRLEEVERVVIERALEVTGQNQTKAAALLGVTARTLWNTKHRARSAG
ncbi:MAG TPA: helix-turn-helix domain-containing protein, partial [Gemmatimonadaceae bacterium]|nr:helix-turn-helix domain-containing protein [Gemmatimonadaceae bacterium]